ncbi:MAG: ABC transporter substrate-binding protein [Pseudomonadota bacterium]
MISRRQFLMSAALAAAIPAAPVFALTTSQASNLVAQVAGQITAIMNGGGSRSRAIGQFEQVFNRYADVSTISRSVLGPVARSTSRSELNAFAGALTGYLARKYGRNFFDLGGGTLRVQGSRDRGRFVEVSASATVQGRSNYDVTFRVWDKSGSPKFIDMLVEGVSLVTTERSEIGALLDQRGGSVSRLTRDLANLG